MKTVCAYFSRLGVFCCFLAAFIVICYFIVPDLPWMPLAFLVPFTLFFVIKEAGLPKWLYVAAQVLVFFGHIWLIVLNFAMLPMSFLLGCLALLFIYSMRAESDDFLSGSSSAAVVMNTLIAVVFTFIDSNEGAAFLPIALTGLGIATISRLICIYYNGLGFITLNKTMRNHNLDTRRRFVRRSQRIAWTFIGATALTMALLGARDYQVNIEINRPPAAPPEHTPVHVDPVGEWGMMDFEEFEFDAGEPFLDFEDWEPWDEETRRRVIMTIVLSAAAVLVLVILWALLRYVFVERKKRPETDIDDGLEEEAYSEGRSRRMRKTTISANRIIRAMFKKKVNEHRKRGLRLKPTDTALIISDNIPEDIAPLTNLYHQARYSAARIDKEDIAKLKKQKNNHT